MQYLLASNLDISYVWCSEVVFHQVALCIGTKLSCRRGIARHAVS